MSVPQVLKGRYEIREILGQGGMGVVYRAYDNVVRRDVALKTLRDTPTRAALEMFFKECNVLAAMSHPNIIEIFDLGEYNDDGESKPFFVMPLLTGVPLDRLIKGGSHRLTVDRAVEIIAATCRGLHAAHERGLIHRDIKPSNIFVMDEDAVKIIDFGVAHMVEQGNSAGIKGTLMYMAPEQLQMKAPTPASDIFALGVVAYEALTRRKPFEGATEAEIAEAILRTIPPAASDINPAVNQAMSRAIHKAMAKQPWNRYASAREFGETLTKALRNEPIEFFNPARIQPRIERAQKTFEAGDLQFASEILSELESEGHIEPAMTTLRRQIELATRTRAISQLLESARTRFEHDECALALQKVQEILQLDPGNAQALGLRASIENKLTTQKLDEWYRLARQHLDNSAFGHARDAIRNVMQIRPGDAKARQIAEEIDQREAEFLAARKEKQQLYQHALEAWNAGEVSVALNKLERVLELDKVSPDTSAPEQTESYQQLYNKVRSEHESFKNAYAEARKLVSDRNFAAASAIVEEWLAKRPGHALFQALKFDIDERQRQEISGRIAGLDLELDAEPDLDRKVSMLERALAAFPGEAHFERQLKPLREKRDLVNSIAAKARWHEERGQFADALAQWEILRTIYSQYPGLEIEIERVMKRRDQQALAEAKGRWIQKIEKAVDGNDLEAAARLCGEAETEFPGDAELAALKKQVEDAARNAAEAEKLIAQGRALCAQQWFDEGLETMRKAVALAPKHTAVRTALIDTLLDRARVLLETDWRAAEPLIQQAFDLDPNNAIAKSLRTTAADHKRDETVVRCFTQARQHRAAGDLEAALKEAEACYAQYPLDPRLQQLRDILLAEIEKTRRSKQRPEDIEMVRHLEGSASGCSAYDQVSEMLARAKEVAGRYPEDQEFQAAVASIEKRLLEIGPAAAGSSFAAATAAGSSAPPFTPAQQPPLDSPPLASPAALQGAPPPAPAAPKPDLPAQVPQPPPGFPATAPFPPEPLPGAPPAHTPGPPPFGAPPPRPGLDAPLAAGTATSAFSTPAAAAEGFPAAAPAGPARPEAQAPVPPPHRPKPQAAGGISLAGWVIIGTASVLVILLGVLFALRTRHAAPASSLTIAVKTAPEGAVIRVDGEVKGTSNFDLAIPPGKHQLEARLDGYQPASVQFNAAPGAGPIELALEPIPHSIRIVTDLPDGRISIDGSPSRELQDGQAVLDGVAPGEHSVKVTSRSGEAVLALNVAPGAPPLLTAPPQVKNLAALAVANLGGSAYVFTSIDPAKVELDGAAAGDAVPGGLALRNLAPGTHEISAGDGKRSIRKTIEIGGAPVLTAFLQSDQNIGTILVLAGEDGAHVLIDGKPWRRPTARGGQVRIPKEPKEYRVRIVKDGFEDTPEQTVQISRGEEKKLVFKLVPKPTTAKLQFRGATPGAQVFLDGREFGTVGPDGSFHAASVPPGEHSVELRSGKLRSRPVRRSFAVGQTVELAAAEVAVRPGTGTIRLNVTPPGAQVTVARAAGGNIPVTGTAVEVEEGSYTVTARAAGHSEKSETVQVTGGQTVQVNLALPAAQAAKPRAAAGHMEGWEKPWQQDGEWYVRKGGGIVLYRPSGPGIYAFNLMLSAGGGVFRRKDLEWVASWVDGRNYILFRLEKDGFRRIVVANGKKTESPKRPHGLDMKQVLATVQVEVTPDTIVNRLKVRDQWVTIDQYSAAGANLAAGRFGIQIEGNDEVRLSGFSYSPKD